VGLEAGEKHENAYDHPWRAKLYYRQTDRPK
jgi:hypothetical protein